MQVYVGWKMLVVIDPVVRLALQLLSTGGRSLKLIFPSINFLLSMRSRPVNNSFKTVKAMDFKFDKHISSDSPGMTS